MGLSCRCDCELVGLNLVSLTWGHFPPFPFIPGDWGGGRLAWPCRPWQEHSGMGNKPTLLLGSTPCSACV